MQASWIGYPNTTGLKAIDFRLTDAECDPRWADLRFVRLRTQAEADAFVAGVAPATMKEE